MNRQFEIRPATVADAVRLAQLAERCFRDAFAEDNSAEDMDLHCAESYNETLQAREIQDPLLQTILVWDDEELAGYAQCRVCEPPAACDYQRSTELQRFYVDQPWHGKGLAQAMMSAVMEQARMWRCDGLWLGVWSENVRALAFYHKYDFEVVGEKAFMLGNDLQQDLVMARSLKTLPGSE